MTPILLIPGNMCDQRVWAPVAQKLEKAGHEVRHAGRLDQPTTVEMAYALLAAQHEPVIAIGFSMGAIVAVEMAARVPERIAALGLVAFNASADLPERAAVRPRQQADVRAGRLASIVADELKPNYLGKANKDDVALRALVMQMAIDLGPDIFLSQSEALRTRRDLRPVLPSLTMPVFLACGREDRLCPPQWHRCWVQRIGPNARFKDITGAGHLLPLERPGALSSALEHWLAEESAWRIAS
jgi:pimeloyl-ACP methyl ester carboxylesterase